MSACYHYCYLKLCWRCQLMHLGKRTKNGHECHFSTFTSTEKVSLCFHPKMTARRKQNKKSYFYFIHIFLVSWEMGYLFICLLAMLRVRHEMFTCGNSQRHGRKSPGWHCLSIAPITHNLRRRCKARSCHIFVLGDEITNQSPKVGCGRGVVLEKGLGVCKLIECSCRVDLGPFL